VLPLPGVTGESCVFGGSKGSMMKEVYSKDPDKLLFRSGWNMAAIGAGLFFGCVGAILYYVDVPVEDATPESVHAVGVGFAALGAVCIAIRGGTTIDRKARTITQWVGLLVPLFWRTRPIEASAVRLTCETSRQRGITIYSYPITFVTPKGDVPIASTDSVMPAWSIAQSVATFLGLELLDESETQVDTRLIPTVLRKLRKRSA